MSLKCFSVFSSGGHFVQPSGTILAYLVEGHFGSGPFKEHLYEIILKLGHWPTSRCR